MEASAVRTATGFSTGLAEIVLVVDDVPKTARFYREVVGLTPDTTVVEANEEWPRFARLMTAVHGRTFAALMDTSTN